MNKTTSRGIGFFGVLFLIFLTLKLAEVGTVAAWSWWWVTAPLWMPTAALIGLVLVTAIVAGVVRHFDRRADLRRQLDE